RIPAMVRWPKHIRGGSNTEQVAIGMDRLPTLLTAAGTQPHGNYPSDGMNLLPALTDGAAPVYRKLFWRYRFNEQRALRDGNMKYLRIAGNTFLFNVVDDPLERANLKNRQPDLHKKLVDQYEAWNATMLAEDPKATSAAFDASVLADHFGNHAASGPRD